MYKSRPLHTRARPSRHLYSQQSLALGMLCLTALSATVTAQTLTPISPPAPFQQLSASDISSDGTTVVGELNFPTRGYRWTTLSGTVVLNAIGTAATVARSVNATGSVVVGKSGAVAVQWTGGSSNPTVIPSMPVDPVLGNMDDTGLILAGYDHTGPGGAPRAFRWLSGNLLHLPTLAGATDTRAYGTNLSVLVGSSVVNGTTVAVYWRDVNNPQITSLGHVGNGMAFALAADAEGSVFVGWGGTLPGTSAGDIGVRWHVGSTGFVAERLPTLEPGRPCHAVDVSADGLTAVGSCDSAFGPKAVAWNANGQVYSIAEYLEYAGLDMSQWQLGSSAAISADGRAIAGNGRLSGVTLGWVARLPCLAVAKRPTVAISSCQATVSVVGIGVGELQYRWRRDGVPLQDIEGRIGGASSPVLALGTRGLSPAGYDCLISNGCGTVVSESVAIVTCAVDFDCDGSVTPDDLGDYINCYFAQPSCSAADFNADSSVDPDDLGDFINGYFAGCP